MWKLKCIQGRQLRNMMFESVCECAYVSECVCMCVCECVSVYVCEVRVSWCVCVNFIKCVYVCVSVCTYMYVFVENSIQDSLEIIIENGFLILLVISN